MAVYAFSASLILGLVCVSMHSRSRFVSGTGFEELPFPYFAGDDLDQPLPSSSVFLARIKSNESESSTITEASSRSSESVDPDPEETLGLLHGENSDDGDGNTYRDLSCLYDLPGCEAGAGEDAVPSEQTEDTGDQPSDQVAASSHTRAASSGLVRLSTEWQTQYDTRHPGTNEQGDQRSLSSVLEESELPGLTDDPITSADSSPSSDPNPSALADDSDSDSNCDADSIDIDLTLEHEQLVQFGYGLMTYIAALLAAVLFRVALSLSGRD